MKIQMRNGSPFDTQRLFLGSIPVGVFDAHVELSDTERQRLIEFCWMIWNHLMITTNNPKFTGLIRFDLVPEFLDDRSINPVGIYELNAHSPECIAVAAALGQKHIVQILVDRIKDTFGNQQIAFVIGKCAAKNSWGGILFDILRKCGLNIVRMSEEEIMKIKPPLVWRFGDLRTKPGDASHFSDKFSAWLLCQKYSLDIFNSILSAKCDFSRKSFLINSKDCQVSKMLGNNRSLESSEDIVWSLDHYQDLVVKPDGGASGNDIYFGSKLNQDKWISLLRKLVKTGGYSIWEAKWLPDQNGLTYDISPTFWAHEGIIYPLYTLIRVDHTEVYQERGVINVAQGAGVAEMIPF